MCINFGVRVLNWALVVLCVLVLAPRLSFGQEEVKSYEEQEAYLENHGKNAITFNFGSGNWKSVLVKMNGTYQKDITKKPSQNFEVNIISDGKGSQIYKQDLYGAGEVKRNLSLEDKEIDLSVGVKLISVHGASSHAAGKVTVIAFRERPGVFYIKEVTYNIDDAKILSEDVDSVDEIDIDNIGTSTPFTREATLKYTESKTLEWGKTLKHSEGVDIAIGYDPGEKGGLKFLTELHAQFTTSYKEGRVETKTAERGVTDTFTVPADDHYSIYIEQTTSTRAIPYTVSGYILEAEGNEYIRKPEIRKGTSIFTDVHGSKLKIRSLKNSNSAPIILKNLSQ